MTIEKAMRLASKWASGGVCTLREGEAQEYHKMCYEALKKQVPMTPVVNREHGTEYGREYYACPYCGDFIKYKYGLEELAYPGHCTFCGQTIDWEK